MHCAFRTFCPIPRGLRGLELTRLRLILLVFAWRGGWRRCRRWWRCRRRRGSDLDRHFEWVAPVTIEVLYGQLVYRAHFWSDLFASTKIVAFLAAVEFDRLHIGNVPIELDRLSCDDLPHVCVERDRSV